MSLIDRIVNASRKECPKIVESVIWTNPDTGQRAAMPDVTTGCTVKQMQGYCFQDKDGRRYGQSLPTEKQVRDTFNANQHRNCEEFRTYLESGISQEEIKSHARCWRVPA